MKGSATTRLTLYGNFNGPSTIASKGSLSLNDLSITNPDHDPLVSIGSFEVMMDTLNVKEDLYPLWEHQPDKKNRPREPPRGLKPNPSINTSPHVEGITNP